MSDDKTQWITSRHFSDYFSYTRDSDCKVDINGILVPITRLSYDSAADSYIITLYDGEDLKIALAPDPPAGEVPGGSCGSTRSGVHVMADDQHCDACGETYPMVVVTRAAPGSAGQQQ